jgi:hypothetical protein
MKHTLLGMQHHKAGSRFSESKTDSFETKDFPSAGR